VPIGGPARAEQSFRPGNLGELASSEIDGVDRQSSLRSAPDIVSAECDPFPITRPDGINLGLIIMDEFLRSAALRGDEKDPRGKSRPDADIRNLGPIGRPARQCVQSRRIGELKPIAAIDAAAPYRAIRIGDVRDPVAVARVIQFSGRNSGKVCYELTLFRIVTHQFPAALDSIDKELLPIRARCQSPE